MTRNEKPYFICNACPAEKCSSKSWRKAKCWAFTEEGCIKQVKQHLMNSSLHNVTESLADELVQNLELEWVDPSKTKSCKSASASANGSSGSSKSSSGTREALLSRILNKKFIRHTGPEVIKIPGDEYGRRRQALIQDSMLRHLYPGNAYSRSKIQKLSRGLYRSKNSVVGRCCAVSNYKILLFLESELPCS